MSDYKSVRDTIHTDKLLAGAQPVTFPPRPPLNCRVLKLSDNSQNTEQSKANKRVGKLVSNTQINKDISK
jgi:hypothetical protein